jgi:hypothetical protein
MNKFLNTKIANFNTIYVIYFRFGNCLKNILVTFIKFNFLFSSLISSNFRFLYLFWNRKSPRKHKIS